MTDLEEMAGPTIIRAVRSAYEVDSTRELARLVLDRYGTNLLQEQKLRVALISRMTPAEAKRACEYLNLELKNTGDNTESYRLLESRFGGPYTERKSSEFVEVFNLPEEFKYKREIDQREAKMFISSSYGQQLSSKGVLHPYQLSLKDSIGRQIYEGKNRLLAQMPTGAGKTMTALELVVDFLRSHKFNGYIVWIVDSNELADQALVAFNNLWLLRGDRGIHSYRYFNNFESDFQTSSPGIVFTSFSKCWAAVGSNNKSDADNFKELCKRTSLVIVDEAHTSVATTYSALINHLISYNAVLLGLTATPSRNGDVFETSQLRGIYGSNIVEMLDEEGGKIENPIQYLQESEYLATITYEQLDSYAEIGGIKENEACKVLAENSDRNSIILKQIERAISINDSTIVFACTVDHVIALVALCRSRNLDVDFIIGEVPQSKRIEIFERFKSGQLKVIINHELLSTGVDLPNVNRLIITRPIGSPILYSQIIGRALRGPKNGGNRNNTIVNIKDNDSMYPEINLLYQFFTNQFRQ
ncbi:DEAD/DEAH box helicase [Polynucleobacter sp. JS-JIR-II-50]|uniref:DEAD/DEAH box helicase n=1 Tax=Polynucleobacter sp. JS-JIR-II-50 TaxID=2576919 RepID=UPI001BFDE472|nr:DEAD/DEAH box helicase [Polynucleobacter sp. JS-JIR-II-50]QWE05365.1 DEAD/DEAH box helicase [Polynucleobacter sp. JS-JIR-II-50]